MNLYEIQKEQKEWSKKNFGEQPAYLALLGAVEELGELAHAHLKWSQRIRGDEAKHAESAKDAVGDTIIYLMDYANRKHIQIDYKPSSMEMFGETSTDALFCAHENLSVLISADKKVNEQYAPKSCLENSIRVVLWCLESYCYIRKFDFERIVTETWEIVRQRDWKANPATGTDSSETV